MKNSEESTDSINFDPHHDYLSEVMSSREETTPSEAHESQKKVASLKTSKGSVYTYLPDGRTQRFKTVENNLEAPQDLLVFIPRWELVAERVKRGFPDLFKDVPDHTEFMQVLLRHFYSQNYSAVVSDGKKEIRTHEELENAEDVFLYFINRDDGKKQFNIPLSKHPELGYATFDARYFKNEEGGLRHEAHIGNEVSEINYLPDTADINPSAE